MDTFGARTRIDLCSSRSFHDMMGRSCWFAEDLQYSKLDYREPDRS